MRKSLPNTIKNWKEQLSIVYEILTVQPMTPSEIKAEVHRKHLTVNNQWLNDLLGIGRRLKCIKQIKKGQYGVDPEYAFMLKPVEEYTDHEKSKMIEVISTIPHCMLVLESIDYGDYAPRNFLVKYLNPGEAGFDETSMQTALVLLNEYGFLRKCSRKIPGSSSRVSYQKVIDYPKEED